MYIYNNTKATKYIQICKTKLSFLEMFTRFSITTFFNFNEFAVKERLLAKQTVERILKCT